MDVENHDQNPADARLQDDQDATTTNRLVGVVFGGRFKVGEFLRHENHADVYSVTAILPDQQEDAYEARVYDLQVDLKKLRYYRLRNLKRLSLRKVHEENWDGKQFVVYTTNTKTGHDSETTKQRKREGDNLRDANRSEIREIREKTRKSAAQSNSDHKREVARLKQLEKRRVNRTKGRSEVASGTSMATQKETDDEDAMPVLLYLAYNDRPELLQELPDGARTTVEKYLRHKDLVFENDEEMGVFTKTKQKEAIFLSHLRKKMPSIIKKRHDTVETLLREQMKHQRFSSRWNKMKVESVDPAWDRLNIANTVQKRLPILAMDAESSFRDLRKRSGLITKINGRISGLRSLRDKREALERRIAAEEKSSQGVVPASPAYKNIVSQAMASVEELQRLDRIIPVLKKTDDVMARVQSLEDKCKALRVASRAKVTDLTAVQFQFLMEYY
ncbi:hypothetical protein DL98DRAFT_598963 [Cadophora sp. DSE1049]|nr:hypothetical protein DL98DRAFT_598963 [Cadophora sp. DSE1049]